MRARLRSVCDWKGYRVILTFDNFVAFKGGFDSPVLLRNFSEPEDDFAWSDGKWCEIGFSFKETGRLDGVADLIMDLEAFHVADALPRQSVFVYLNGLRISSSYVNRRTILSCTFDRRLLKANDNIVTIDTPDVVPPITLGIEDSRLLGIKLFTLQIRKAG